MALLKPLHTLNPGDIPPDFNLPAGSYFYFPFFGDTRLYRESLNQARTFELFIDDYPALRELLDSLSDQ
jgi:hypothetical protein